MYTLKFADGKEIGIIDGVTSLKDNTAGEQRDSFKFMVSAADVTYGDILTLVSNPDSTREIILRNDSVRVPALDEDGNPLLDDGGNPVFETRYAAEAYYGYIDLVSIQFMRNVVQEGLLNVPAVFEWVYEVILAEQTNTQKQAAAIDAILSGLPDEDAAQNALAFPLWTTMGQYDGTKYTGRYETGYRARFNELLYKCIQGHAIDPAQFDWNPADAAALWTRVSDPSEEFPEWVQPGSTNAYELGDRVTHIGRRWISTIEANVWEPGASGVYCWEEVI